MRGHQSTLFRVIIVHVELSSLSRVYTCLVRHAWARGFVDLGVWERFAYLGNIHLRLARFHRGISNRFLLGGLFLQIKNFCLSFFFLIHLFLLNKLAYQLLFVNLIFYLGIILAHFLLHNKHRLVVSILYKFVFYVFVHHIETIFYIIFSSSRHFFYDFRPFVADWEAFFQDLNIFKQTERVFLNLRIEEVNPSFTTLLAVSSCIQIFVKLLGYLTPLFCAIFSDELHEFFIFFFYPVTLLNRRLFVLIEFILALWVITSRNKSCNLDPVIFIKFLRCYTLTSTIFLDGPLQQFRLIIDPVLFGVVCFFPL